MNKVVALRIIKKYIVWFKFEDGYENTIDFLPFLGKGMTKELLELSNFNTVKIEQGGGILWLNGYDFCPNYLHQFSEQTQKTA